MMKTEIFKSHSDFLGREDKNLNGVSAEFAESHPDFEEDNKSNKGCWNCSRCSRCSDCYRCSDCSGCSRCSDCYRCSDCSGCSRCSDCYRCSDCSRCSGKQGSKDILAIPKVEKLNQKVSIATDGDNSLEMGNWHTCDTTHCWAGWIVHLAGSEGYKLAETTSNEFAAMMIFKESNGKPISPVNFYLGNEEAKAKIDELAKV